MPKITFQPSGESIDAETGQSILAAARAAKIDIRFGCGVGQCGLCGVGVKNIDALSPITELEKSRLMELEFPLDGSIRLACRAKMQNDPCEIDLSIQDDYDV